MITPQQIEQISFGRATFGGYDMQSVDEILGPLTEDYVTLYKENALLKSKMRILVSKLEEYRNNEESMKDAIVNAQKTCDMMVKEAEVKCTQMLTDANALAAENAKNADALIAAENERVEDARRAAAAKIDELTEQLASCIQTLERIKTAHAPSPASSAMFDYDSQPDVEPEDRTADVADEISSNLEAALSAMDAPVKKAAPEAPVSSPKFQNLSDHFGQNYDPNHN
ncbi:MAG: DivIVA domain-containing protein [Ruminococcaceae bacterium]|nr:DivIVA domain-containing protein [Oscillospiraceae bacterium]